MSDGYRCQRCAEDIVVDTVVPNGVWQQITEGRFAGPREEVVGGKWSLLCFWCIDTLCRRHGIECAALILIDGDRVRVPVPNIGASDE